jgi:hypothetical protein
VLTSALRRLATTAWQWLLHPWYPCATRRLSLAPRTAAPSTTPAGTTTVIAIAIVVHAAAAHCPPRALARDRRRGPDPTTTTSRTTTASLVPVLPMTLAPLLSHTCLLTALPQRKLLDLPISIGVNTVTATTSAT